MSSRTKGIICIILAACCFASQDAVARLAGPDIPSIQKCAIRSITAFLLTIPALAQGRIPPVMDRKAAPLMLLRCTSGIIATILSYYALDRMLLANASMLQKAAPFFAVIFSIFLLGEKPGRIHVLSILAAGLGCVLVIKPSFTQLRAPELAALGCGMFSGFAYTCLRKLSGRYHIRQPVTVFYGCLSVALATSIPMIIDFHPMSGAQLICLVGAGVCAVMGQYAVTAAYGFAPARDISVYDYSQVAFSAMWGFLLYGQMPDGWSFVGYGIMFAASLALFLWNRREAAHGAKEAGKGLTGR